MVDNYDKSLEGLFTGEMIKYTLVFNKVKRSDFGTGCNVLKKNYRIQRRVLLNTTRKRMF